VQLIIVVGRVLRLMGLVSDCVSSWWVRVWTVLLLGVVAGWVCYFIVAVMLANGGCSFVSI
jgi:ammonia channel protein AmtB